MSTVSAIIIVYNDAPFIARAIESVLNQTYEKIEIIVVDDGSEDNSLEIAKSFSNHGVQVFGKENGGAASARNFGAKYATGEYFAFLDSDDVWMPEKIEKMVQVASSEAQDPILVYSGYYFVDESLRQVMRPFLAESTDPYREVLHCRNQMVPSTMIMHRRVFDALEGFPEDVQVRGYEDAVFTLLATRRFRSIAVRDPLTLYLYSDSGQGRAAVYDYKESVSRQKGVFICVGKVLHQDEFKIFKNATWINTFCKFAMYGQLHSARRLKKEMCIKTGSLLCSTRGMLALFSAYSRVNVLLWCKNVYQFLYSTFHCSMKI